MLLPLLLFLLLLLGEGASVLVRDVVVYDSTPGGIMAAVAGKIEGQKKKRMAHTETESAKQNRGFDHCYLLTKLQTHLDEKQNQTLQRQGQG